MTLPRCNHRLANVCDGLQWAAKSFVEFISSSLWWWMPRTACAPVLHRFSSKQESTFMGAQISLNVQASRYLNQQETPIKFIDCIPIYLSHCSDFKNISWALLNHFIQFLFHHCCGKNFEYFSPIIFTLTILHLINWNTHYLHAIQHYLFYPTPSLSLFVYFHFGAIHYLLLYLLFQNLSFF